MSWHEGEHVPEINVEKINTDWQDVKGDIPVEDAAIWFTKFLANNPYLASEFLIGPKLGKIHPIQDIIIRTWFKKDFNLIIAGRGFSKSYTVSIFIVLYALFNPGTKVIICSASFRQAKMIFDQVERFIESEQGGFLKQCSPKPASRGTDRWEMKIGTSTITATPLTEKNRGYRANLVIIDEYLSVPEKIVSDIIIPFLAVKRGNGAEQRKVAEAEQILIDRGEMQEWQRTVYQNNKIIGLSSATYKFQPLYKNTYLQYLNTIHDPTATHVSHSLFRLGYKCAAANLLDLDSIENARKTLSSQQFDREYNAIFTDDSGGFYNVEHILRSTVPVGEEPKVRFKGKRGMEYIIAVDPNSSAGSETADNFAISVLELAGNGTGVATLVHGYASPKSEVKRKVEYFRYLMDSFNVVLIILDHAGGPRFIEEYNSLVPDEKQIFMSDLDFTDDDTYRETKNSYNKQTRHIAFTQIFNKKNWIRDANEMMQGDLQHSKIMFASPIANYSDADVDFNINLLKDVPDLEFNQISSSITGDERRREFIEHVDKVVSDTAKELALIQTKSDSVGNISFDLPAEAKSGNKHRARKDSYTSLLLGNYARRCYEKLMSDDDDNDEVFAGFFIN